MMMMIMRDIDDGKGMQRVSSIEKRMIVLDDNLLHI